MIFGEGPIIKNIAGDLNKLFIQGSRVNQPINNVEGDAAADQGMRDLLAARDPVIQEISVGMSGEQSTRYTVSGTPPLSLPNSLGKPLKAWSVDVLPYQEGTGDPSPDNVRPIHGTDKLNLFVEESYDQSATPKAVLTLPQTVYTGTIGSEGGESRDAVYEFDENLPWATWGVNNQVQGITGFYFYRANTPTIDFTNINAAVSTNWLPINNRIWSGGAVGYYTNNSNADLTAWYEMVGIENSVAGIVDTDTAQQAIGKFKAYLVNNPLQVRFSLITPAQFPITAPTIPTPTGTATTWATAEDGILESMEVTYIKSE